MFQDIFQESRNKSVTSALTEYQETLKKKKKKSVIFFAINTHKLKFSAKTHEFFLLFIWREQNISI